MIYNLTGWRRVEAMPEKTMPPAADPRATKASTPLEVVRATSTSSAIDAKTWI